MSSSARSALAAAIAVVVYAAAAVAVVFFVSQSGTYPSGSDTLCHLYKGDVVYKAALQGDLYPLYDQSWYNGVELMRYWAPAPVYVLAALEALAAGDLFNGYLLFVGCIAFFGALPWLFIGIKTHRRVLGAFVGLLWFFMPNNLVALFVEGNLPRSLALVLLPLLLYHFWVYLGDQKAGRLPIIAVLFALIALCHSGYAGMIAISLLLFSVVYAIANRTWHPQLAAIAAVALGYGMIGLWLVPSLIGGITSTDSSEVMATFFQSAATSLNPFDRTETGFAHFYFGLAAFAVAVFGIVCSKRASQPGFWTAIVIFVCTTSVAYPLISILPGSQYLWMLRFISIALALILIALVFWKSLKAWITVALCVLLVIDVVPSLSLIYGDRSAMPVQQRMEQIASDALLDDAQKLTTQRCAVLDESGLGATGAYLLSGFGDGVNATFGAGYQSASTASNIVQLNRALDAGAFDYLFDRSLELGNDTVLVMKGLIPEGSTVKQLDKAARRSGYAVAKDNGSWRLYKLQKASGSFGTVSKYRAIGIGSASDQLSLQFPAIEETDSDNLNDYTYKQLSAYDIVYLDGFTYDNQSAAEELVRRLSRNGTRVVIAADGIPENKDSHDRVFMGVRCNTISFKGGFPELDTVDGKFLPDLFPQGYTDWQTVYLEGLDECWGKISDPEVGADLEFYGTVDNDNLVMVGLNLSYHYALTKDERVGDLLGHAMDLSASELPKRELVDVDVEYGADSITVTTDRDDVNTALAYHDVFSSDQKLRHSNNLTFVDKGTTVITMHYPYFGTGLAVSIGSLVLLVALVCALRRARRWAPGPLVSSKNTHTL